MVIPSSLYQVSGIVAQEIGMTFVTVMHYSRPIRLKDARQFLRHVDWLLESAPMAEPRTPAVVEIRSPEYLSEDVSNEDAPVTA